MINQVNDKNLIKRESKKKNHIRARIYTRAQVCTHIYTRAAFVYFGTSFTRFVNQQVKPEKPVNNGTQSKRYSPKIRPEGPRTRRGEVPRQPR